MIRPLGRNVTAKLVEGEKITKAGIFLADNTASELAPKLAEVLAIGEDVTLVKVGEQVVFKPYATYDVAQGKDKFIMLEEEDILGVLELA